MPPEILLLKYNILSARGFCLNLIPWIEPARYVYGPMVYRPLRYEQMMKAAEAFDVRARRMFNGMGIYTGEKMFAFLVDDAIGLKLAPSDLEEAMGLDGAEPFRTEPSAEPMREYVKMPKAVLDNYEKFVFWVERSANYAQSKRLG